MAPPSAVEVHTTSGNGEKVAVASQTQGLTETQANEAIGETTKAAKGDPLKFPMPPKFEDKYKEREFQKGRLALAFRIFAKLGFDEGVAGHITLRVRSLLYCTTR